MNSKKDTLRQLVLEKVAPKVLGWLIFNDSGDAVVRESFC